MPKLQESFIVRAESLVDGRSWIQVMPVVTEARNGPWFFTVTEADLATYAASLEEKPWKIPIDRDHGGDTANPDLRDTRAAGWFTGETKVLAAGNLRPDKSESNATGPELWAEVKWTPRAIQEIQDGEFRFISPTFDFKQKDTKTGLMTKAKEIIAATLTNRPFFDMAPVTAAVVWAPEEGFRQLSEDLEAELNRGLAPTEMRRYWVMDVADGKALVRESSGECRTWVVPFTRVQKGVQIPPQSEWTEAEEEWVEVAQTAIEAQVTNSQGASSAHNQGDDDMDSKVIASALGLSEDADEKVITEAIAAAKAEKEQLEAKVTELEAAKATGEPSEIEQLKKSLADTQTELDTERSEIALAKAVDERRLAPAAKEALAKQFEGNLDGLKAVLAAMPEGVVPKALGSDGKAKDEPDTKVTEEKIRAGDDKPVDGLDLVARAEKILADAGKSEWTEAEYAAALDQAEREKKVAA